MGTDTRRLAIGALLLLASTVVIMATGAMNIEVPAVFAGVAAMGMAAGALLVGMSEYDAAV